MELGEWLQPPDGETEAQEGEGPGVRGWRWNMGHSQVPRVLALITVLSSLEMGAPASGLGLCLGSEVSLGSDLASAPVGFAA